jgi:hypothetical protein
LYDTCEITPLSVYIDVTCDDKLEKLIISGNPSIELLEETKEKLIQEFSELTGSGEMKIFTEAARNFFYLRNTITGMEMAAHLIASGEYGDAIAFFNKSGVKCAAPENNEQAEALMSKINLKLKNRLAKFKEAKKRYESLQKQGEKPTRKYYNKLLVTLSTCEIIKMQLDRNRLTLSEFAEYINILSEYHNHLKSAKNGRKH